MKTCSHHARHVEVEDARGHTADGHLDDGVRERVDLSALRVKYHHLLGELPVELEPEGHNMLVTEVGQDDHPVDGCAQGDVAHAEPLPCHYHQLVRRWHDLRKSVRGGAARLGKRGGEGERKERRREDEQEGREGKGKCGGGGEEEMGGGGG
eukprot:404461-Hanusia_phi.AAC.1